MLSLCPPLTLGALLPLPLPGENAPLPPACDGETELGDDMGLLSCIDTDARPGMCGGSTTTPGLVRLESGSVLAGVELRRSLYDMKERRFAEVWGVWGGSEECGWCGEAEVGGGECGVDVAESAWAEAGAGACGASSSDEATDEVVEKYAEVGVMIDGVDASDATAASRAGKPAAGLPACATCGITCSCWGDCC